MPGPPGKRVREAVAEVERGPMPSLAVSPPPAHRASRQILIDSDDVDLRIAEKPERVHVAAYGQRQSTYAQLRSWIAACHPRGTFRGTVFWPIPTQRVPSVRSTVLSVQLARVLHEAILLVNGRSAVRSRSPAPRSDGVKCPLLVSVRGTNVTGWSVDGALTLVMAMPLERRHNPVSGGGPGTRQSRRFRSSYVADAGGPVREAMHAVSRRRI